ncbi:LysM domain [Burkholderiaceae bacterium]
MEPLQPQWDEAMNESVKSPRQLWRAVAWCCVGAAVLATSACTTRRVTGAAPVVDRSAPVAGFKRSPNQDQPGFYIVRPGDTLYRIGLETGQGWRDLQLWNAINDPNSIEVGQVIRVAPPSAASAPAASPVVTEPVASRPLEPAPSAPPAATTAPVASGFSAVWPANGPITIPFDETKNKGISIAGKAGDPVLAAADGRVVVSGAVIRGLGNLVVLQHPNGFLTAYAHNQSLLVKEDQTVRQGQRIATMGSSDSDTVRLHFEVRRQGKPVDPLAFLPKR